MRVLLLLVVACGGGVKQPQVVANRAPPPPRPACSEERIAELADTLRTRWNPAEQITLRCTAGSFPQPGYFLEARGPARDQLRVGVLASDGVSEIAPFVPIQLMMATQVLEYTAVDLDGDGIDEVLEKWRKSAHGAMGSDEWLIVRRLADGKLTSIEGPHLNVYFPELGGCHATSRLEGRTFIVKVSNLPGIPPSDCLSPGTHAFVLENDQLVETKTP